jgi:hypothetical protein
MAGVVPAPLKDIAPRAGVHRMVEPQIALDEFADAEAQYVALIGHHHAVLADGIVAVSNAKR